MTTSEMENATFRFISQCLNRLRDRAPHSANGVAGFNLGTLYSQKNLFLSKRVFTILYVPDVYLDGLINVYITCIIQFAIVRCLIFQVNVRIFYVFIFTKFITVFKLFDIFILKFYTLDVYVNKIVNTVLYKNPQNIK
jgi:hypothetical protein